MHVESAKTCLKQIIKYNFVDYITNFYDQLFSNMIKLLQDLNWGL